MEEVLKQLYEIESAASAVKSQADTKKKELEAAMNKKFKEFNQMTAQKTAETLEKQKQTLNAEIAKELADQRKNMDNASKALEDEYQQKHTQLANQILETLIKE